MYFVTNMCGVRGIMVSGLASGATFSYCAIHVILHFVEVCVIQSFVFFCYFILHINFSCCKTLTFNILSICVCVCVLFFLFFLSIFIIIIIIFVFFCLLEMKCRHNGNLSQIFSILCSFNYRHQHCPTTCKLQGRHWYSCIVKKQIYCRPILLD